MEGSEAWPLVGGEILDAFACEGVVAHPDRL